jgi:uncharacterized protein (DUF1330 family)
MPAYVVAELEIIDEAAYDDYRRRVTPTVTQYGGKYIVRGGAVESLENGWPPIRVAVLEFPTMDQARRWYQSPEYAPLIELRQRASKSRLTLLEGQPG